MKNQIILFLSAAIITFLIGYLESVTDPNFPVSGSFGIEGKKVSYKLNKTHFGNSPFKIMVISDLPGLKGNIEWKKDDQVHHSEMQNRDGILEGFIESQKPVTKLEYRIILEKEGKKFIRPSGKFVKLTIYGKIPGFVLIFYNLLLFGGLFLSVRMGLEIFNESRMIKKFSFVQSALFLLLAFMISPLLISYKLEAINHSVLPIVSLLDARVTTLASISVFSTIVIFLSHNKKFISVAFTILTILVFIMFD